PLRGTFGRARGPPLRGTFGRARGPPLRGTFGRARGPAPTGGTFGRARGPPVRRPRCGLLRGLLVVNAFRLPADAAAEVVDAHRELDAVALAAQFVGVRDLRLVVDELLPQGTAVPARLLRDLGALTDVDAMR